MAEKRSCGKWKRRAEVKVEGRRNSSSPLLGEWRRWRTKSGGEKETRRREGDEKVKRVEREEKAEDVEEVGIRGRGIILLKTILKKTMTINYAVYTVRKAIKISAT